MKGKLLLSIIVIILILDSKSISQPTTNYSKNTLDYYFPLEKNTSTFVMMSKGQETKSEHRIFYLKRNTPSGIEYEILERYYMIEPGGNIIDESIIGMNLIVTLNQISIASKNTVSAMMPGKTKINYKPPQILLKLPKTGTVEKWKYKEPTGDYYECSAELTKVIIDGITKNAIKVYRKAFSNGKYFDWASMYEYYVEGIGLWKTQLKDGTDWEILKDQSFDSTIPDY